MRRLEIDPEVTSKDPLESYEEAKVREWAELYGWWVSKFTALGKRGVPDRIFIRSGIVVFIEMKKHGKEPTRQQLKRHNEMRAHGAIVHWADRHEDAIAILESYH